MQQNNQTIDALKGIAILLVVFGHVIQRTLAPWGDNFFLNPAFKIIYTFHMPLFFFISGYLLAYSLQRRDLWGVLKRRAQSLLVPFISWGILGVVTTCLLAAVDGTSANFWHELIDQLIVHPAIWFLFTLFVCSALLLSSAALAKRWGGIAFAAGIILLWLVPCNDLFALYYIQWFYAFYLAGFLIHQYNWTITNQPVKAVLWCAGLILFIVLSSYWTINDYIYVNNMNFEPGRSFENFLRMVYRYSVGFLGIALAWEVGAYCSKTPVQAVIAAIGIYSLDIYLIQRYLVEGIYPRLVVPLNIRFDFNSFVFIGVFVPLATAAFVGMCWVIARGIRANPILNRWLLGGRAST